MKKYRRILAGVFLLYLLLAAGLVFVFPRETEDTTYKVEINRIMKSLSEGGSTDKLDLRNYKYVTKVEFLPEERSSDKQSEETFYSGSNPQMTAIQPLYQEGIRKGYVKLYYVNNNAVHMKQICLVEVFLFLLFAGVFGVLVYLYRHLIRPFHQLDELPHQLAQGHFDMDVPEEKSRFFGHFQWGMSQLKDTLQVTKKRELELEKEKKLMLLSLSHDMKTPLNTIQLYAKAIEDGVYTSREEIEKGASGIRKKTEEIEHYVQEIMKSSREDLLDIPVEQGEFYLGDVIEQIRQIYGEKCRIRQVELTIEPFENCLLPGDRDRVLEVFENLFENAFKYGDGKKIVISFAQEDYCQLIRVKNSGNVVSAQEFNHLFDSFFRAANSQGKPGNGLGLYICRQIMRKMDGEIFAEQEADGMTFVVVLRM